MARKIKVNVLNRTSIQDAITAIEEYKKQVVKACETFVSRLADEGIIVAQNNTGSFGKYITFAKEIHDEANGCEAIMLATNTGIIKSEWLGADGNVRDADVSPLLMVEFGSGKHAKNPKNIDGVGRGTFPSKYGESHGNQEGWWYMDLNHEWHYSTGYEPRQPMLKASEHIVTIITQVGKEVFGRL